MRSQPGPFRSSAGLSAGPKWHPQDSPSLQLDESEHHLQSGKSRLSDEPMPVRDRRDSGKGTVTYAVKYWEQVVSWKGNFKELCLYM